jgi:diadenosine tetraphosphate (Ap4A) HIT family hydrolase
MDPCHPPIGGALAARGAGGTSNTTTLAVAISEAAMQDAERRMCRPQDVTSIRRRSRVAFPTKGDSGNETEVGAFRAVASTPDTACTFCDLDSLRAGAVLCLENELCLFVNSDDLEGDLLRGSGVIIPKVHRLTVFDLAPAEVTATFELLGQARPLLDERYKPDGFNIGWSCYAAGGGDPHAHMHVLLRFADEPRTSQRESVGHCASRTTVARTRLHRATAAAVSGAI